ncbi:MAG: NDP-sugar synthase [Actinomycetota bacterium]|nr:NDP-sugar synthase [Actinomycetota bacterium]
MKAVILVGGEGTRLRPLTETTPKPLLPFMNRPFLAHVLDHLAAHGVDEAVCSSPYLESTFHSFLESRRGQPPAVRWVTEPEALGTAGAVAGAGQHLDGSFFVLNGDILTDLDLAALMRFHRERDAVATITLTQVADARPFGLVETDPDGRVLAFKEKPSVPVAGTVNAGTYVLETEALEAIPPGKVSIERETYPLLIEQGRRVFGFVGKGYWLDLGTPQAYLKGHVDTLDERVDLFRGMSRPFLARDVRIDAAATVGEHVVCADGVAIGAGARVDRAVLHAGAGVGARAIVEGSILGRGSQVGEDAVVRGSVLGEDAVIEGGAQIEDARVRPGEHLALGAPR